MAQLSCSYYGGLFNGRNCPSCSIVGAENEFVHDPNPFPYDNTPDFYNQPPQHHVETYSYELCGNDSHYGYDCPPREQATNLSTHTPEPSRHFNFICYDGEESTIPLNEILYQIPSSIAITPVLLTVEPEDSLIMGDEDLFTIPEKESDGFIKSSVEDLVLIPRESEDTYDSDKECDLPFCDSFMTFSNPLFNSNDDFTSSDDESLSDEDVSEDNVKIYSNPLFKFDDEYISSDVNPLFEEVLKDIESKVSDDSNLDEPALLVTPLFDYNEDECFDPGGNVDKINVFDIPLDFEHGYYDSKVDVLYLESFLSDDTTPNLPPEVFLDRDPRSLSDINDLKIMVKFLTLEFQRKFFLQHMSEDTIFDPDIFAFHFSSLEPVSSHRSGTFICFNVYPNILHESRMEICSSTRLNPNITMI
uniref:Reverse transcriptase domain-containing protein n=1 Tax=Tanacetum cinerariifolium TaxID=118510 RepID=A0A6L2JHT5_TANCI|nr:hypothetical protein [Tanacetum cinerariifolium]